MNHKYFQVKNCRLAGSSYSNVYKRAWKIYSQEKSKSKRRTYIRSVYFGKDKIFLDIFWNHLKEKSFRDRYRRLKYYCCAIEMLKKTRIEPVIINTDKGILYRFTGKINDNELFVVQVKENKHKKQKFFISVFPK